MKALHIFPSGKDGELWIYMHINKKLKVLKNDNVYEKINEQKVMKEKQRFKHEII